MGTLSVQGYVPFHISGNTTDKQNQQLHALLEGAANDAYRAAITQLDQEAAQAALAAKTKLRQEVTDLLVECIHRHAVREEFESEKVDSRRDYPPSYRILPLEAQATALRKLFKQLNTCEEKVARRPLPYGAEGWFAIPRWQLLGPTYNEALDTVLEMLAAKRKFENRLQGKTGHAFLRPTERLLHAEKILAEQQHDSDILVVAAQCGMLYRGCSSRRARSCAAGNEFGLGSFAMACILLTHPDRLCGSGALMIDCSGDEASIRGDGLFDRVPLFDYGISGMEFSMFYEDRARELWGSPSGFLVKPAQS